MNDISITEAYFMYSVRTKGKLSGSDCRKVTGLLTAALWEMTQAGIISINGDKIQLHDTDSFSLSWFQPLYEHIKEMEHADIPSILQDYCSSWSDRHLNALSNAIGMGLETKKMVTRAKLGIFNGRTYFMPHQTVLPGIDAELQVDMMYHRLVPTDSAFLWLLLKEGRSVSKDIPEDLQQTYSEKVKEALADNADPALISAKALLDLTFSHMKKQHMIMD